MVEKDIFKGFFKVLDKFSKTEVEYILIGGFAVILHGLPRLTQDIDILIKNDEKNIDKLRNALYSIFKDDSIGEITIEELSKYSVIRYGTPNGFYIDILVMVGKGKNYEMVDFETIKINNVSVNVATIESLYDLKRDTIRPEDKKDAIFLKELLKERKK
jgi:hypothetical protein